jgi:hypothetical protein
MANNREMFVLCCLFMITASLVMPAYAEVISVKTDKPLYKKNMDKTIVFTGTAEDSDINELVTVVISDPADNFVVLRQGYIGIEKTFEVKFTDKDLAKFSSHGIYNATAFVVNATEGVSITFDFSLDGSPVIHPTVIVPTETQDDSTTHEDDMSEPEPVPAEDDVATGEKSIHEKIKERIEAAKKKQTQVVTEVQNNTTMIAENSTTNEVPKQKDNSDIETSYDESVIKELQLDSNLLYTVIGIGSAGAAGAVVYSMKNKFKHKVDYSSYFTSPEKTETTKPSTQSDDDYALMILKNRLAKGEITVDEFNKLKNVLKEP